MMMMDGPTLGSWFGLTAFGAAANFDDRYHRAGELDHLVSLVRRMGHPNLFSRIKIG